MTANNVSYSYANVASFTSCTGCHYNYSGTPGDFSFSEGWSESSDYSVFNSYCSNWSGNGNVSYYGNRRAGCVLMLVVNGTMPSGNPGGWAYQDEYLQWYCSSNGPGGGVFGF